MGRMANTTGTIDSDTATYYKIENGEHRAEYELAVLIANMLTTGKKN